ncbi:MAG: nodulation protein NfeD, partial [Actinomycetota bacterium]
MRDIVTAIGAAKQPVVCWTGPTGARAASAGAIIMLGCPYAAMAPGTNIGAAHPVGFSGEVMSEKVTNDAAAYARALAQAHGRDARIAEAMVRDSTSLTADEALHRRLIDAVASTRTDALREAIAAACAKHLARACTAPANPA